MAGSGNRRVYWLAGVLLVALVYWQRSNIKKGAIMAGDYLKPRGIRNNNPGNLKKNGIAWQGLSAEQGDAVFYQFVSPDYGIRALSKDLSSKYSRGLDTVRKIIDVYAPPSENNTVAYIAAVAAAISKGADTRLSFPADLRPLLLAIIQHENGQQPYSSATIDNGLRLAGVV